MYFWCIWWYLYLFVNFKIVWVWRTASHVISEQNTCFLAHLSRRLSVSLKDGTRAGVRVSVRPYVHGCVGLFTLSDMNISETSWPITIEFHLKHNWGGELAALGFGPDRIRPLVPWQQIAAIGYNGKILWTLYFFHFSLDLLYSCR